MKVHGIIFGTRILLHMHMFVCASMCEFWEQNSVNEGNNVKPGKNSIFLKNGKKLISVENRKFSRSRKMKRTSSLNSSCEI